MAEMVKQINPEADVRVIAEHVTEQNVDRFLDGADMVWTDRLFPDRRPAAGVPQGEEKGSSRSRRGRWVRGDAADL